MIRASGPGSLLVIVPAWNEEGAIAQVVQDVRRSVPDVPVLVIDDCSTDNTIRRAREAGADILALPHHLGLGGCDELAHRAVACLQDRSLLPQGHQHDCAKEHTKRFEAGIDLAECHA